MKKTSILRSKNEQNSMQKLVTSVFFYKSVNLGLPAASGNPKKYLLCISRDFLGRREPKSHSNHSGTRAVFCSRFRPDGEKDVRKVPGIILARFWDHLGSTLGQFCDDFGLLSASKLMMFSFCWGPAAHAQHCTTHPENSFATF